MKVLFAALVLCSIALATAKNIDEKPVAEQAVAAVAAVPASPPTPAPASATNDTKLSMRVYYEALCPDSKKLLNDFGREYHMFKKYITVEWVPFGRAKSLDTDGNEFECHHGPKECVSNRIHSCGIEHLKSQDARQQFAVCQMNAKPENNGKECFEEAGGEWKELKICVDGDEGKKLQLQAERITKEIAKPKLKNVPTVVFNDAYDQELQDKAVVSLNRTFCGLLASKKIPVCE